MFVAKEQLLLNQQFKTNTENEPQNLWCKAEATLT